MKPLHIRGINKTPHILPGKQAILLLDTTFTCNEQTLAAYVNVLAIVTAQCPSVVGTDKHSRLLQDRFVRSSSIRSWQNCVVRQTDAEMQLACCGILVLESSY
jgi:hypothetical protein